MDFFVLLIAQILHKGCGWLGTCSIRRILAAAVVGSTGSVILFLVLGDFELYQVLVYLLLNPLMVGISFRSKKWTSFIKDYALVVLVMMLFGGIISWGIVNIGGIRHFWLYAGGGLVICLLLRCFLENRKIEAQICEILLKTPQRSMMLKGFVDTGNLLMDPFLNQPVHIIQEELLSKELEEDKSTIRYIPYHSLGQEHGILPVVTMVGMYIRRECDNNTKTPIYVEKPVFGLAQEKLFQKNNYQVILNSKDIL
jgi:stage II sporulation protein GA (sporulation sigma-E factor processing peptidase)